MRKAGHIVGQTLQLLSEHVKPGVTTGELDAMAYDFIKSKGAIPTFKGYAPYTTVQAFPGSICASVNEEIVHGIPSDRVLKEGDIIALDCGAIYRGYHGDSAVTVPVGKVNPKLEKLLETTKEALEAGIDQARPGNRLGDISYAIQEHTEKKNGYGVVRELVGHGLGRSMHEDPQVPNYGKRGNGPKMNENIVLAIEPMINLGTRDVYTDSDGWTVRTRDGKPSVHFEHDVCIKRNKALILSDYSIIEAAEKANPNLNTSYY